MLRGLSLGLTHMRPLSFLLIASTLMLAGCPSSQSPVAARAPGAQPIAFQLQQQDDSLQDQRVRTLLDFESESDLVFAVPAGTIGLDRAAHTGSSALRLQGSSVTFKVSSVLFGTKFPENWTLLGGYVRPQFDTPVTVELWSGQTVVARSRTTVQASRWTFVGVDLTASDNKSLAAAGSEPLRLQMTFESVGALAGTNIDDVLLIDNNKTLLDTLASGAGGWKISRRGYTTTIDAPGRFKIDALAAATNDKGWLLSELGAMRVILRSAGPVKYWVLYNDGRFIEDGRLSVKGASGAAVIESHARPADVEVDEATGKLDVHTEGDANNDGYNELRGSYQLVARAPRLQLKIKPAGVPAAAPVLEIRGLPPGDVSAMVEGRLIEPSFRLPDGRVLLTLPLHIDRPMAVTVRSTPAP